MDDERYAALSTLSTGVYLLTTGTVREPVGMVASWVVPAGYDPPLVAAAVRINRFIHDLIPKFGYFGLNVFTTAQLDVMKRFKVLDPHERFKDLPLYAEITGAPLLKNSAACLDCRLLETYQPGDHSLFLGRVEAGRYSADARPLTSLDYGHAYLGRY